METITIENDGQHGFTVRQGDRYADNITFDEMLGLVVHLTKPDNLPYDNWIKTQEEWDRYYENLDRIAKSVSTYIDTTNDNVEVEL